MQPFANEIIVRFLSKTIGILDHFIFMFCEHRTNDELLPSILRTKIYTALQIDRYGYVARNLSGSIEI